jgi:hypothetical protein
VDGLASLEAECDPVPSGVGTAVWLGVSSEGWILAKPKKIPVRPSWFNGSSDESGRFANHQHPPLGSISGGVPVGIPRNRAPRPKP